MSYPEPRSRLRAFVFFPVFAIALAASLWYVLARPAVYATSARLQFDFPAIQLQPDDRAHSSHTLAAAQTLTSGTLLEDVLRRVKETGGASASTVSSVHALQSMLSVEPAAGTNVIELRGEGSDPQLLQQVLNAWIEAYRQTHRQAYDSSASVTLEDTRALVQKLGQNLASKRAQMDAFRKKYDIVSLEREENQATAQLRGLNTALNDARAKEVNAEARRSGIRDMLASGKGVDRPGDRAIIANLDKRAIELRERMKDLEHDFTPQYLNLDPRYKALRANLTRIEQQIETERKTSSQLALQSAEEEVITSRDAAVRLQQQLAARKREVQDFTTRFSEHTGLANEVRRLEESYNAMKERLGHLEITNKAAAPTVTVLSQPSVPERPLRPDYWRDGVIAAGGSLLLGLIAVWFVEFFKRSGVTQPMQPNQSIIHIAYAPNELPPHMAHALAPPVARLPESIVRLPRELSRPEMNAMWSAASPEGRCVIAALLGGLSLPEITALRYEDVDPAAELIHAPDDPARAYALREPLKRLLSERRETGSAFVFADRTGAQLSSADAEGLIACAACDAGLAHPEEVNSDVVRHTYLAFLVRQGARLADIGGLMGRVAPAVLREYGRLSPPGPGLALEEIDPVFPAASKPGI